MSSSIAILLIEDSPADALLVQRELRRGGLVFECERVEDRAGLITALGRREWSAIISDFSLPGFSGVEALEIVRSRGFDLPFIIVSGTIGEQTAVEAMRAGANDYLIKGNVSRLVPVIERELREMGIRSERKLLEQQLLQSQKMESVGRLAGGIAHDFNNVLTGILCYGELLKRRLGDDDPRTRYADEIIKAAQRAANLTGQLLAFSRKQVLQPSVVLLNTLVTDMQALLSRLIGEHIELETELDPELGYVKVDPSKIEQVILNLVVNARDAMPDGGRLLISTTNATDEDLGRFGTVPSDSRTRKFVQLRVKDSGTGIPEAIREKIFEPFFTTKSAGRGTGLGLATVYGVVTQSGGRIHCDSSEGTGTIFHVLLPMVDEVPVVLPVPALAPSPSRSGGTILIVEDEDAVRSLTGEILEKAGFKVLAATNGHDALERVHTYTGTIHLVVTDVIMPVMGGREFVENLRKQGLKTTVLFVSGYTAEMIEMAQLESHNSSFLQKPFTPSQLLKAVQSALEVPARSA